ncbi:oligosaccharide flippase family protein [Candidatus Bathyarchaeota archaeon]|nr:oligosaccharide flippase family protein [Candidatus Bathyarchaeota archaeon]
MSKAAAMAKVSVKGSFNLFWGLVVSSVISAVGTVIIARVLSPSEYGLYTIALAAPSLIATFRDWGMNSAMIKYAAQYNAENNPAGVKNILAAGLIFETVLGLTLSILSLLRSERRAGTAVGFILGQKERGFLRHEGNEVPMFPTLGTTY